MADVLMCPCAVNQIVMELIGSTALNALCRWNLPLKRLETPPGRQPAHCRQWVVQPHPDPLHTSLELPKWLHTHTIHPCIHHTMVHTMHYGVALTTIVNRQILHPSMVLIHLCQSALIE